LLSGRASNPDGSVDVYFGTKAPAGKESNRVPTNPSVASTIRAEEGILRQGVGAGGRRADCCAGGVIVTAGGTAAHRKLIIDLVNRYKLPTVYPYRYYAVDGDLITYGPNTHEPVRGAAGYVDRILKGEKPGDIPVQAPTKYDLIVNLKTAKALGLNIPQSFARDSRRGHRISDAMSAIGPNRAFLFAPHMSAFGGKADMG
jgi:hypothetical protein